MKFATLDITAATAPAPGPQEGRRQEVNGGGKAGKGGEGKGGRQGREQISKKQKRVHFEEEKRATFYSVQRQGRGQKLCLAVEVY